MINKWKRLVLLGAASAVMAGSAADVYTVRAMELSEVKVSEDDEDYEGPELDEEGETLVLNAGSTYELEFYEGDDEQTITFKSADTKVATVSAEGVITAVSEGTVVITMYGNGNLVAGCTVKVIGKDIDPETVKLEPEFYETKPLTLKIKAGYQLQFYPGDNDEVITFKSKKSKVAEVDEDGYVTAKKKGKTVITMYADGKAIGSCKIKVKKK